MQGTKPKRVFIRFRKLFLIVSLGFLGLLIWYFPAALNVVPNNYFWAAFLVLILLYLLAGALISLGYYLSVDVEAGTVKEVFFGKIWREVNITDIYSVEHRMDKWDWFWLRIIIVFQLALIFASRGGGLGHATGYTLKGNFNFKLRFPLIPVDYKLLDELISLKGRSLNVDSYYASVISRQSREILGLKLAETDKIANVLGYILYTILFIILTPILVLLILYIILHLILRID